MGFSLTAAEVVYDLQASSPTLINTHIKLSCFYNKNNIYNVSHFFRFLGKKRPYILEISVPKIIEVVTNFLQQCENLHLNLFIFMKKKSDPDSG